MRRAGRGKLVPVLAAQLAGAEALLLQQFDGVGVHLARGVAAGAEGAETSFADAVEDGFGENAAGRVPGAQKKNIEDLFVHSDLRRD